MTRKAFLLAAFLTPLLIAASVRADNMGGEAEDPVCCECPTSNWYVGLDVPVLKPHLGTLGFGYGAAHPEVDITPSHDFEISPRVFLGWENADGLGLRARYWNFDADATETFPAGHIAIGPVQIDGTKTWLEAQTFDLEATQRGCLGQMQFQLAGGVRYAKMETGVSAFGTAYTVIPFDAGIGMEFEGLGPTVAIDLRRPFGSRGFALVGGARASWLYGQTDAGLAGYVDGVSIPDVVPLNVYADDHMMQISEVSLGVEWSRCFERGGKLSVAALWEAQAWEWAPVASLIHQDIGLTGPTFSVSYMR